MAAGSEYTAEVVTADGTKIVENGQIQFLDSVLQPLNATLPIIVNGAALPTADPHVVGQIWASSHVLTVSAG